MMILRKFLLTIKKMLTAEQVTKTIQIILDVFPKAEASYEVELSPENLLEDQFYILLAKPGVTIHLKLLNQLKALWDCEDVTVRTCEDLDRFLYLAPYSSKENLQ